MVKSIDTNEPGTIVRCLTDLLSCHDLPADLPHDPMPLLNEWFEDARRSGAYDDFNAMTIATATASGRPSARIVLCKSVEPARSAIVFYTNYTSRKGRELGENPQAAATFYWPHARRQARLEGRVERTTAEESDAYFRTRPLLSRIGSAISPQSQEIASRAALVTEAVRIGKRVALGATIERPAHWGGYRLMIDRLELWSGRTGRLHDRAVWTRTTPDMGQIVWRSARLGA